MGTDENAPFVWKSGRATGAILCDCPHRESTIDFRQAARISSILSTTCCRAGVRSVPYVSAG
jgi:hypothetical protein